MSKTWIPAVGYLRRSTEKQEASIRDQKSAIEKYAFEKGYRIVRWYIDDGISGDATEKRVGFLNMIDDANRLRDFKAILCWDQDRFGRFDSIEAGEWISPLRRAHLTKLVAMTRRKHAITMAISTTTMPLWLS